MSSASEAFWESGGRLDHWALCHFWASAVHHESSICSGEVPGTWTTIRSLGRVCVCVCFFFFVCVCVFFFCVCVYCVRAIGG